MRVEIGEALARGIPVVPVLLDGASLPDSDILPEDLKELVDRQAHIVEFRTFDTDVQRLIRILAQRQAAAPVISTDDGPRKHEDARPALQRRRHEAEDRQPELPKQR